MSKRQSAPSLFDGIISPELVDGITPFDLPDGPKIDPSQLLLAPASHSQMPERKKPRKTKGTSGPSSSELSKSCDRKRFSASKYPAEKLSETSLKLLSSLRFIGATTERLTESQNELPANSEMSLSLQNLTYGGSMEYAQTWKVRVTPSGRQLLEHTASGRRTSDSDCIGWPTCRKTDGDKGIRTSEGAIAEFERKGVGADLPTTVALSGWVSPTSQDHSRGGLPPRPHDKGIPLTQQVAGLTGWSTPQASDMVEGARTAVDSPQKCLGRDEIHVPPQALSGFPTPTVRDHKDCGEAFVENLGKDKGMLSKQVISASGTETGESSNVATVRNAVLNPAFSRWLMGYPKEWCIAAIQANRTIPTRRKKQG